MDLIDPTSLTKIGNMTLSGGLAAHYDNVDGTIGYAAGTSGWSGVTLAAPTKIGQVTVRTPSNGVDASGSTTTIILKLYAKSGSAPANGTDGVLLGTLTYTDVNVNQNKTVVSTDQTTLFDHVWVYATTGVWTSFADLDFFAADAVIPPSAPTQVASQRYTLSKSSNDATLLGYQLTDLTAFKQDFYLETPAHVKVRLRYDIVHRGNYTGYNGALSLGAYVVYKYSTTYTGLDSASWIYTPNLVAGRNLCEINPQHYEAINITGDLQLAAGYYRFGVLANAATDAGGYTTANGLAGLLVEGGYGLNWFSLDFDHGSVLVR